MEARADGFLLAPPRVVTGPVLQSADRRPAWVGFSALTVIMAAHAVMETARDSLFLSGVPATRLPYAYLAIAALSWAVLRGNAAIFGRARDKRRLFAASLAAVSLVDVFFWATLSPGDVVGLFALYVVTGLVATVTTVQFWLLLDESVTVTQAKRVFGPVAAGGVAGALIGALLARAVVSATEPRNLLLLAAALWLAAAALPRHLAVDGRAAGLAHDPGEARGDEAFARERLAGGAGGADVLPLRRYLRRLLALVVLATMTVTAIDYLFKSEAAAALPPDELAAFFATFYVGLNATALVVQVVVSGSLLRRVGVSRALAVMPSLLLVFSAAFAWAPGIVAAILLRGTDGALRHSLHRTGVEILYLPLGGEARARIKAAVDGLGHRGGQALASVMVLGSTALGLGTREIGFILFGLAAAWVASLARVRAVYLELFRATLARGEGPRGRLPELDRDALESLFASLNGEDERVVATAIEILEAHGKIRLVPHGLLLHPSKRVVLRALDAFSRDRTLAAEATVVRLLSNGDPEVRAAALRTLVAIDPRSRAIEKMTHDSNAAVRATAMVGSLVAKGGDPDPVRARLALAARNGSPSTRSALAAAVRAHPSLYAPELLLALVDDHPTAQGDEVNREALVAMEMHPDPRFVRSLVPLLARSATRSPARRALLAIGEPALGHLRDALERGDTPRRIRRALPGTIARFDTQAAIDALLARLPCEPDSAVANRILRALRLARAERPEVAFDARILEATLARLLERGLTLEEWSLVCAAREASLPPTPTAELLLGTVREERALAMSSVFLLLDLLHPDEGFDVIRRGLENPDRRVRSAAREVLEHAVSGETRRSLLSLLDDGSAEDRLRRARRARRASKRRSRYEVQLGAMLEDGSESIRCIAAERIGELGLIGLTGALRRARARCGDDDLGREAIDRSLALLNASLLRRLPGVA